MATNTNATKTLDTTKDNAPDKDIVQVANQKLVTAETRRKQLLQLYKKEKLIPMYLSPMYKPYFGNTMTISINGISIYFKVDGSTQMVPETYADEITSRRIAIDAVINKQSRMAKIPQNAESSPGELNLF